MKQAWNSYSEKFLATSVREKYLILLTGFVGITFGFFTLFIEDNLNEAERLSKKVQDLSSQNKSAQTTIDILQQSLSQDPNEPINKKIARYNKKISSLDDKLLLLTSDLINPIQMRFALIDLLKTQRNVSLLSFEVIPAEPLVLNNQTDNTEKNNKKNNHDSLTLYKHSIKLTLSGSYFQLRDYLAQLEQMKWTFFWHEFNYQLVEYPKSELTIQMYSLSTKKEFIGV